MRGGGGSWWWRGVVLVGALLSSWSRTAAADPLIPGPNDAGYDAALAAKMGRFERQIHGIMTVPLGWGLQAVVSDANARTQIEGFVASGAATFEDYSGQHVYSVLDAYGEFGDLGMFGGVQAGGDALRYVVLRDEGADPAEIDAARQQLLAAMDGLHWYTQITGTPGLIARGLQRVQPQAGTPPLPGPPPTTVPLFDQNGDPQPADKAPTWRDDVSGELPDLVWLDDTSKDQFIGYVFALGTVYEAVAHDDTIPSDKVDRLVQDARAIGQALMETHEVDGAMLDLVLMDADGRPTSFYDLNADVLSPGVVLMQPANPFNAAMALGAMRTLYQITGDEDIGSYYYDELIGKRGYLDVAGKSLSVIYFGTGTNYSTVNMAFVAVYGLLRYEPEPDVAMPIRDMVASQLYGTDPQHSARGLQQSFFDFIVAGFDTAGTSGIGQQALADGLATLVGHPDAPYWDPLVENCDAAEIAAGSCVAVDDTTVLTLASSTGWSGTVVAVDPLPIEIRPPTNFAWRTDPHAVNGGGSSLLNPGGGIYAAYWLGRRLAAGNDGLANISPDARGRPVPGSGTTGGTGTGTDGTRGGSTGTGTSSATAAAGSGTSTGSGTGGPADNGAASGGCGCRSTPSTVPLVAFFVPMLVARRRRWRSRSA